jgi:hypothetical protein
MSLAFIKLHQSCSSPFLLPVSVSVSSQFPSSTSHSLPTFPTFFLILHSNHFIRFTGLSNPLAITSGEIPCNGLDPLAQQFYTGLLYCPSDIITYSPTKSYSEYNCFKSSLKGLFTRTCNYEIILPGTTTRSVLIA